MHHRHKYKESFSLILDILCEEAEFILGIVEMSAEFSM